MLRSMKKTIPRATMIGTFITIVLYFRNSDWRGSIIPAVNLQHSQTHLQVSVKIFGENSK